MEFAEMAPIAKNTKNLISLDKKNRINAFMGMVNEYNHSFEK